MWDKLKHVKGLGAGAFGTANLYKLDKKLVVVKRQRLLAGEHEGNLSRFANERDFYTVTAKSKYFAHLLDERIITGSYDYSSYEPTPPQPEIAGHLALRETMMTYAGESLRTVWPRSNAKQKEAIIKDLVRIVRFAHKAGYVIFDMHFGNVCWLKPAKGPAHAVLIDFGEVVLVDADSSNQARYNYDNYMDLLSILLAGGSYMLMTNLYKLCPLLKQSPAYEQVRETYVAIHSATYKTKAQEVLEAIEQKDYSVRQPLLGLVLAVLWMTFDPDGYSAATGFRRDPDAGAGRSPWLAIIKLWMTLCA
jgi:hypothetical protein